MKEKRIIFQLPLIKSMNIYKISIKKNLLFEYCLHLTWFLIKTIRKEYLASLSHDSLRFNTFLKPHQKFSPTACFQIISKFTIFIFLKWPLRSLNKSLHFFDHTMLSGGLFYTKGGLKGRIQVHNYYRP